MYENLMSFEQIQKGLKDKRLYAVKDATGISYPTLKKLAEGVKANYSVATLCAVSKYINESQIDNTEH